MEQPDVCIGTLGHVANGKSSIVKALTAKATQRFRTEIETERTIKIGYANCKIYKCNCPDPTCYKPYSDHNTPSQACQACGQEEKLVKYVSFVDCPGHYTLMTTVLSGACVIDSAIIVFGSNNTSFPAPQTKSHIEVAKYLDLQEPVCVLNKIDLIEATTARSRMQDIRNALTDTPLEDSPIIPVSANMRIGLGYLCKHIASIPSRKEKVNEVPTMMIVSSFNANKQGSNIKDLKGGIIGGSMRHGSMSPGNRVTIIPGLISEGKYKPLKARVLGLRTGDKTIYKAVPGGLIAAELSLDPSLATQDGLLGSIAYVGPKTDYAVFTELYIKDYVKLVCKPKRQDDLILTCASRTVACSVKSIKNGIMKLCANPGNLFLAMENDNVALSKKTNDSSVMIGFGKVLEGTRAEEY